MKKILIILLLSVAYYLIGQEQTLRYSSRGNTLVLSPNTNLGVFDLLVSTNLPPNSNSWQRAYRIYNLDYKPIDIEIPDINAQIPVFFKVEKALQKYPQFCLGFPDYESEVVAYFSPFGIRYRWKYSDTNYNLLIMESTCVSNSICLDSEFVNYANRYAIRSYINTSNCIGNLYSEQSISPPIGVDARLKTNF